MRPVGGLLRAGPGGLRQRARPPGRTARQHPSRDGQLRPRPGPARVGGQADHGRPDDLDDPAAARAGTSARSLRRASSRWSPARAWSWPRARGRSRSSTATRRTAGRGGGTPSPGWPRATSGSSRPARLPWCRALPLRPAARPRWPPTGWPAAGRPGAPACPPSWSRCPRWCLAASWSRRPTCSRPARWPAEPARALGTLMPNEAWCAPPVMH